MGRNWQGGLACVVKMAHSNSVWLSHPGSENQNRNLYTCAHDVQITRIANNMVNRYTISINSKLKSYKRILG
jgi:hypothetical protein